MMGVGLKYFRFESELYDTSLFLSLARSQICMALEFRTKPLQVVGGRCKLVNRRKVYPLPACPVETPNYGRLNERCVCVPGVSVA